MALQKATVNGHVCLVDSGTPSTPVTNVAGDGGDINATTAAAAAWTGLHRGATDPATWDETDATWANGMTRLFVASASGTDILGTGKAVDTGDFVIAIKSGGTVKAFVFDYSEA